MGRPLANLVINAMACAHKYISSSAFSAKCQTAVSAEQGKCNNYYGYCRTVKICS